MKIRIGDQQFILGEPLAAGDLAALRSDGKAYRAREGEKIAFTMPHLGPSGQTLHGPTCSLAGLSLVCGTCDECGSSA